MNLPAEAPDRSDSHAEVPWPVASSSAGRCHSWRLSAAVVKQDYETTTNLAVGTRNTGSDQQ